MEAQVAAQTGVVPQVIRYESRYEGALRAFLKQAYPQAPLKADLRFFRWRFQESPFGDSLQQCVLAVVDDRVVGQWAALRDRIYINGVWRECVWMIDLIVLPEYRGGHTALRLFRAAMATAELLLVVGAGPNQMGFYKVLRWRHVHVTDTLFAALDPFRLWRMALAAEPETVTPVWRETLLRLGRPVCRAAQGIYARWASRGADRVEVTAKVPPDVSGLQDRLLPRLSVTTDRSAEALHWKFTTRPYGRHFFVTLRAGSTLRAYAAVKLMQRGATRWADVVDYLADPDDGRLCERLMAEVLREVLRRQADFVRLRSSLVAHRAALPSPFWTVRNRLVIDDVLLYSPDRQLLDTLCNSQWHLTAMVADRNDHGADET